MDLLNRADKSLSNIDNSNDVYEQIRLVKLVSSSIKE
jgi:hypothetical protein